LSLGAAFGLTLPVVATLLALGATGGLLAGMLGVGGGMVLVPFTTLVFAAIGVPRDLTLKMALATSLATILFTAISSVRAHHARGAVRWDLVARLAPGIVVGALLGAQLTRHLPSTALHVVFGAFLFFAATQMLFGLKPNATRALPGQAGLATVGATIGSVSAVVGAGGAFMSVPFMNWCNVAMHQAVGTASALGLPIAAAGTVGYIVSGWSMSGLPAGALGLIHVPALAALATASVLTAPLGAWLAHRMNVAQLRRVFAVLLYIVGAAMLYRG
jgi:uncharacterized membrane protein YfcA